MAILYTTHYMEEAERLCDRVGIVDQGRIVAEGTRRELVRWSARRDRVSLGATGDLDAAAAEALRRLDGVAGRATQRRRARRARDGGRARCCRELLEAVDAATGVTIRSVEVVEPDLEAVFLHLTGKALRD